MPVPEITPLPARRLAMDADRINLVVPSVNPEHRFGGVNTALHFFERLAPHFSHARIITTDVPKNKLKHSADLKDYRSVAPLTDALDQKQIVACGHLKKRSLAVAAGDVFIATSWWTAYLTQRILEWQARTYGQPLRSMAYLIQDYECGFYNWSTHYVLADSTYRWQGPMVAVFNTGLLRANFEQQRYRFDHLFHFEPQMPAAMQRLQTEAATHTKKRQILFYGRPTVARNCFHIVIEALSIWAQRRKDNRNWNLYSIGEKHSKIRLANGSRIHCLGKLPIADYARMLLDTAIGISFMVSPHPSYPPLEMAHFGCLVVANQFENKDLSMLHDNIYNANSLAPNDVADLLETLCARWDSDPQVGLGGKSHMPHYIGRSDLFPFAADVCDLLKDRP